MNEMERSSFGCVATLGNNTMPMISHFPSLAVAVAAATTAAVPRPKPTATAANVRQHAQHDKRVTPDAKSKILQRVFADQVKQNESR